MSRSPIPTHDYDDHMAAVCWIADSVRVLAERQLERDRKQAMRDEWEQLVLVYEVDQQWGMPAVRRMLRYHIPPPEQLLGC